MAETTTKIRVNGKLHEARDPPGRLLIDYIRDSLNLKGAKRGCESGECGSCTLLLDGDPICACMLTLGAASGRTVTTIEGVSQSRTLNRVQEAFLSAGAVQCGYCAPGMVMSAVSLLARNPRPERKEILVSMNGNLCPCGGYAQMIKAIESLAERESGT